MSNPNPVKTWANQIRAPFLLLSVLLCTIGGAVAWHDGGLELLELLLCVVGVTLAHVAVNLFNELSDQRTGIDDATQPTPFSGGSQTLQQGLLSRRAVTVAAWSTLVTAAGIGAWLAWSSGWQLILLALAGGIAAIFYTSHFSRWMLGELVAGTTLGSFVVIGTYFAQTGQLPLDVILIAIPPGVLTALLLLLNEFPDAEADRKGRRRHLVITLGHRNAAVLYAAALVATYGFIVAGVALGWFPRTLLLALLTLPLAVKAAATALRHGAEHEAMLPALGANVGLVLGTDLLIAVAYFL